MWTLWYGFHFQQTNPITLPIESFVHNSEHTMVIANYNYLKGQTPTIRQEIHRNGSQ
jgi:hypothetical protein